MYDNNIVRYLVIAKYIPSAKGITKHGKWSNK
jgi:hypothetical protein